MKWKWFSLGFILLDKELTLYTGTKPVCRYNDKTLDTVDLNSCLFGPLSFSLSSPRHQNWDEWKCSVSITENSDFDFSKALPTGSSSKRIIFETLCRILWKRPKQQVLTTNRASDEILKTVDWFRRKHNLQIPGVYIESVSCAFETAVGREFIRIDSKTHVQT